jgi:hypothetical protein
MLGTPTYTASKKRTETFSESPEGALPFDQAIHFKEATPLFCAQPPLLQTLDLLFKTGESSGRKTSPFERIHKFRQT